MFFKDLGITTNKKTHECGAWCCEKGKSILVKLSFLMRYTQHVSLQLNKNPTKPDFHLRQGLSNSMNGFHSINDFLLYCALGKNPRIMFSIGFYNVFDDFNYIVP